MSALYDLLPALYRERDAEEGFPLRALLDLLGGEVDRLEGEIAQLWDDLFVETCRDWVVPYIGDLVASDVLYDRTRVADRDLAGELFDDLASRDLRPAIAVRTRADVARTIAYRRRKGTLAMLEELARDVTGWPAHAVELFDVVARAQHLDAVRPGVGWADLRSVERAGRVDGPFDELSHTVDVRAPAQREGWHNVPNVGFFLWRLGAYPLENVPARRGDRPWRWHASPLGATAPLFSAWRREGDEAGLATELHVAAPIRGSLLHADLRRRRDADPDFTDLYGDFGDVAPDIPVAPGRSVFVVRNGTPVRPARVTCARLDPWPANPPAGGIVAIDPVSGRIALGAGLGQTRSLDVSFHYGFAADLGGGPYERGRWLVRPELAALHFAVKEGGGAGTTHTSVAAALADWATPSVGGRADAIVTILDSRTYDLPPAVTLRDRGRLVIEAANGQRPVLRADEAAEGAFEIQADAGQTGQPEGRAELTLSGVVLEGFVRVAGDIGRLRLLHSTLVPGRRFDPEGAAVSTGPSIHVHRVRGRRRINEELRVELAFSIAGPLELPDHSDRIVLVDSIVDGLGGAAVFGTPADGQPAAAPPLVAERSTVLGSVAVRELDASNSLFSGRVEAERTQAGCVRFSYTPPDSRTPARYRCQPDLAAQELVDAALAANPRLAPEAVAALRARAHARVLPVLADRRYGSPAYAQLHLAGPRELATGAEDGAELGAFCHVKQAQRESNLRTRLAEYLPFGLDAGIVYVT
jgi:hypothetical protein